MSADPSLVVFAFIVVVIGVVMLAMLVSGFVRLAGRRQSSKIVEPLLGGALRGAGDWGGGGSGE